MGYSAKELKLDPVSIDAAIRPVAMGCAVGNLIDNGFNYTKVRMVVRLKRNQDSESIEVWDQSRFGIKPAEFPQPYRNEITTISTP